MMADAFSENISECLDAGMNGHIAKPVDIKLVIKEISENQGRKRVIMKKIMCMFLAVLMILGLAACGSEKQATAMAL